MTVAVKKQVRHFGNLQGVLVFLDRRETAYGQTYPFLTRSISTSRAVVSCGVSVQTGERIAMRLDAVGIRRGEVGRVLADGFHVEFNDDDDTSVDIEARIDWLRRWSLQQVENLRSHKRVVPRETNAILTLGAHRRRSCRIIDLSCSGVAVSTDAAPPLRSLVAVGAVVGRVVRYFEGGMAVQFIERQELDQLQGLLTLSTERARTLAHQKVSHA